MRSTPLLFVFVMLLLGTWSSPSVGQTTDEVVAARTNVGVAELISLARSAGRTATTVTAEETALAREAARRSLVELEQFLHRQDAGTQREWKTRLHWEQTREIVLGAEVPSLADVDASLMAFYRREFGRVPPFERREFMAFRRALTAYRYRLAASAWQNPHEVYHQLGDGLAGALERYSQDPTPQNRRDVADIVTIFQAVGRGEALIDAARRSLGKANVYVRVARNRTTRRLSQWIEERTTEGVLQGWLTGLPAGPQSAGDVEVLFRGWKSGTGEAAALRPVMARCLLKLEDDGAAAVSTSLIRAGTDDVNEETVRKIVNQGVDRVVRELNDFYRIRFRLPLEQMDAFPELALERRNAELVASGVFADRSGLATADPPPAVDADYDVAIQIHETAVEHYLERLMGGARFYRTDDDEAVRTDSFVDVEHGFLGLPNLLREEVVVAARGATEEAAGGGEIGVKILSSAPEWLGAWTVELFPQPVGIRMSEGGVAITVHVKRIKGRSNNEFDDWDVSARYVITLQEGGVKLEREGDFDVLPHHFRGGFLTAQQVAVRNNLRNAFARSGAVPEEFSLNVGPIDLPFSFDALSRLEVSQVAGDDGWLTICWSAHEPPPIVLGRLYQEQDCDRLASPQNRGGAENASRMMAEYRKRSRRAEELLAGGQDVEAVAEWRRAVAIETQLRGMIEGPRPNVLAARVRAAQAFSECDPEVAKSILEAAAAAASRSYGPDSRDVAVARNDLAECALLPDAQAQNELRLTDALLEAADVARRYGRYREQLRLASQAAKERQRRLGPFHPGYAGALGSVAAAHGELKNLAEAETALSAANAIYERVSAVDEPAFCDARQQLADVYYELGDADEEFRLRRAIVVSAWRRFAANDVRQKNAALELARAERLAALSADQRQRYARARRSARRANSLVSAGKHHQARATLSDALATFDDLVGKDSVDYARVLAMLVECAVDAGELEAARQRAAEAATVAGRVYGQRHPGYAGALARLAGLLDEVGEYPEAQRRWREVAALNRDLYGADSWQHGEAAAAVARDEIVLSLEKRKREQVGQLASLRGEVGRLMARGEFATARDQARSALEIARGTLGEQDVSFAWCEFAAAEAEAALGNMADATDRMDRALSQLTLALGSQHPQVGEALVRVGRLYERSGRLDDASRAMQDGVAIVRAAYGPDDPRLGRALQSQAQWSVEAGRFSAADLPCREAVAIHRRTLGEEHADFVRSLRVLAEVLLASGQYAEAEPVCGELVRATEQVFGANSEELVQALLRQAAVYRWVGNTASAESIYLRCLKEARTSNERAGAASRLADLYAESRRFAQAEQLAREAVGAHEQADAVNQFEYATALCTLGKALAAQGKTDEAKSALENSERAFAAVGPPADAGRARCLQAIARLDGTSAEQAQLRWNQAANIFKSIEPTHPEYAQCLDEMAFHDVRNAAEWPQVLDRLDTARRVMREHCAKVLPALSDREQAEFLRTRFEPSLHRALIAGYSAMWTGAEKSAAWLLNGKGVAQEAIAERALRVRDSEDPQTASITRKLDAIRGQHARLSTELQFGEGSEQTQAQLRELIRQEQELTKQLGTARGERDVPSWVEVDAVRRALSADSALVELFRCRTSPAEAAKPTYRYLAWIISRMDDVRVVDLGPAGPIEEAVTALRSAVVASEVRGIDPLSPTSRVTAQRRTEGALRRLSELLIEPLQAELEAAPRWIISPDGVLWLVPWGALPIGDAAHAVERHWISYLNSGRELVTRREVQRSDRPPIVIADPDFDGLSAPLAWSSPAAGRRSALRSVLDLRGAAWARLPGTALEAASAVDQLKRLLGVVNPRVLEYQGAAATEAAYKSIDRPMVLVICTHGYFRDREPEAEDDARTGPPLSPDNPLARCGLVLAGANQRKSTIDQREDGILTGLEIVGTDLRGTELVVLSACETGVGEVRSGEGVAGLRQAFHLAGAQTTIAALWSIPDDGTARLMEVFWDKLIPAAGFETGFNKADALCLAQREMIRLSRQEGTPTIFWAAFTLTGQTTFPAPQPMPAAGR